MKKQLNFVIVLVAVLFALTSCVSKQVATDAQNQRDSLALIVSAKDSLINNVFADLNTISENLAAIKSRENLITVSTSGNEGARRPVDEINNDISAIDNLLKENKQKIESLQHAAAQLRKANLRISSLEKMIADLNTQLGERTAEVQDLREQLAQMGVKVNQLSTEVANQTQKAETLSGEKTQLENQMNTVYYIVGSEKELRDAQIINKQGFIGRTLTVNKNSKFDSFTKGDSRLLTEIPVGHKKATVVTNHPQGSYELVIDGSKVVTKLLITDPTHFWESSKMLIISYK